MKKKIIILSVVAAIGFGGTVTDFPLEKAYANNLNSLKEKKNEIEQKRSNVNSKISETNKDLSQNKEEQAEVNNEIRRLDLAIGDTETKIMDKQEEIKETKDEIEKLQDEIKVLKERIDRRNELLKNRARSFQENGSMVSYIDVLMGAKSFGDFIDRLGAVATIVEADQDILREHKLDKEMLEEKQTEVEAELAKLEGMLVELETMKKSLKSQKSEKDKLMAKLKRKEEQMHADKMELEEESKLLAAQQQAMQKAIQLEQNRIAEQRRLEEQRRKQNNGGGGGSVSAPPVSDGTFTKPAAGYVSSGYGHRWGSLHAGVDIAAKGTVPIVAAADGVVIQSYYSTSYGNVVFLSHSIDGQIYTTVYAHMRSRSVGQGEVVSKGQQLGYMGNTGQSFGQHLHFELHKGPWNSRKSNSIDPRGIVPL
ncbi:peptidoglycan DD-metalloendopeptidase family protein [Bacillus sp. 31A1R]|uniref:Peptidoglycan DD-metalloendopeptidase family protein n=1 Tax=Robertmurraya mangrovi TaxID=3098077 RepID=A0ABU5IXW7_9BACI|nr:peptidoglycan DD-metalloendopeptidase family protein [Bacillus sp. 31A1R]MDZ5471992.1 peptidoglycan DD-metalloendopeptidase family protein [Bacillus sp. 31A1R]